MDLINEDLDKKRNVEMLDATVKELREEQLTQDMLKDYSFNKDKTDLLNET